MRIATSWKMIYWPNQGSEMKSEPEVTPAVSWRRGVAVSAIGIAVGMVSLGLFCFSLGLNFRDEGWSDGQPTWEKNWAWLLCSLVGFAIAILVFWMGFFQTTHSKR